MTTKVKVIILIVALSTSFATGRWFAPTKVVTKTVTVEVEKQSQEQEIDYDTDHHKETDTTEITKPDGTKETTTKVIDDVTHDQKASQSNTVTQSTSTTSDKEVTRSADKVTISAMAALDVKNLSSGVSYGVSVYRPILGPIGVGVFGLTNSSVGVSVGLSF